jgi:copper chaperone CopZ
MYGDHHVVEVRRILMGLPGVEQVYASSAFQVVEVTFNPDSLDESKIVEALEEAGYQESLPLPVETGVAPQQGSDEVASKRPYFRRAAVYENTRQVMSFAQKVSSQEKMSWPCPGLGVIKMEE